MSFSRAGVPAHAWQSSGALPLGSDARPSGSPRRRLYSPMQPFRGPGTPGGRVCDASTLTPLSRSASAASSPGRPRRRAGSPALDAQAALEGAFRAIVQEQVQHLAATLETALQERLTILEGLVEERHREAQAARCSDGRCIEEHGVLLRFEADNVQRQFDELNDKLTSQELRLSSCEAGRACDAEQAHWKANELREVVERVLEEFGSQRSDMAVSQEDLQSTLQELKSELGDLQQACVVRVDVAGDLRSMLPDVKEELQRDVQALVPRVKEDLAIAADLALGDLQSIALRHCDELHDLQTELQQEQASLRALAERLRAGVLDGCRSHADDGRTAGVSAPASEAVPLPVPLPVGSGQTPAALVPEEVGLRLRLQELPSELREMKQAVQQIQNQVEVFSSRKGLAEDPAARAAGVREGGEQGTRSLSEGPRPRSLDAPASPRSTCTSPQKDGCFAGLRSLSNRSFPSSPTEGSKI